LGGIWQDFLTPPKKCKKTPPINGGKKYSFNVRAVLAARTA
jgi:hypothetical protein